MKTHFIIVQIYVDDIIFGSTCQKLCDDFTKIMHDEFEMSMMGELNFFLGLQIKQMEVMIFFNQSKYIKEMLMKFGSGDSKPTKMLMSMKIKLTKDDEADSVDSTKYQAARLRKQSNIQEGGEESVTLTQDYIRKVFKYVGEDKDFKHGSWVSVVQFVNANGGIMSGCLGDIKNYLKNGKLDQVIAIIKFCAPNDLGDLIVTLKDLSGGRDVGGSGVGGSGVDGIGMLDEEEIIKLLKEEEMTEEEWHVGGNVP
nr:retrovirus-related Pol polyprotein from transposon TNT 1-94 [Tanacetum cinerariifolium]